MEQYNPEINIRGTFLDKESLAQALIKGFNDAGTALEAYIQKANATFKEICESQLRRATLLEINYCAKYLLSMWITRWYWKRKYNKAHKGYEFWKMFISGLKTTK